ncbi:hypothetical protein GS425_19395 [Rhodococcus hoagii]|nr:hypothetical protein [Prescottella equi]NKS86051.1 hypothetical protein [Prescottella equi]
MVGGPHRRHDRAGERRLVLHGRNPRLEPETGLPEGGRPHPGKNRQHMDLGSGDLDAEVERVLAAGATEVHRENMDGFRWVTFADPQGNQFCVSGAH